MRLEEPLLAIAGGDGGGGLYSPSAACRLPRGMVANFSFLVARLSGRIGGVSGDKNELGFLRDMPPPEDPRYWLTRDGGRVAWNEYGDPAGRPMIYCHGWPSSRLQARLLHHLARERGIRVLALDRPGMGRSTRQPGRTLASWPALVAGFADALGIGRFAQLGVSGGGPYVLACAAFLPERVAASAVLCGAVPLAGADWRGLHPAYRMLIPLRKLPGPLFNLPLALTGLLATGGFGKAPVSWLLRTLADADRELLLAHPSAQRVLAESLREGIRQGGRGVMADADVYFQDWGIPLDQVRLPIRYWHGGMDRNISVAMARRFVARIPGARLDIDSGEGHFSLAIRRAADAMDHLAASFNHHP